MYFDTDMIYAFKKHPIDIIIGGRGCGRTIKEYLNSIYGKECANNGSKNINRTDGDGKSKNR